MNNQQRADYDSLNRVGDFNTKHQTLLNSISEYAAEQALFNAALTEIKNAGSTQLSIGITHPITLTAKEIMAVVVVKYCLRAGVLARRANNTELAAKLQGSTNTIDKATKTDAISIANNKRKVLADNTGILINIRPEHIAEIDAAIAAYDLIKDAPTENVQIKKATATDQLPVSFAKAHAAVDSQYDLVFSYFNDTNRNVVREFETAKQVIATGIHSTSIIFNCVADENNQQINTYTVTDVKKNKTYNANEQGLVTIAHHVSGHFHFVVSAPGRNSVDYYSIIKRGIQNPVSARLNKLG